MKTLSARSVLPLTTIVLVILSWPLGRLETAQTVASSLLFMEQSNGFFDHFSGPSMDPRWVTLANGAGTLEITDGYLECNSPQSADASAFYYNTKLDKSRSQLWVFSLSHQSQTQPQSWITLVNSSSAPKADTIANWDPKLRAQVSAGQSGSTRGLFIEHWNSSHSRLRWNGGTNVWTANSVFANSPINTDDYYLVGIEIDGPNNRWRTMLWGRRSAQAGSYTFNQGLRLFTLTNWVSWSSMEASDDLWLVCGDALTDSDSGTVRAEWVRLDAGQRFDVWSNSKSNSTGVYAIRHGWGYESAGGGVEFIVQEDRVTLALDRGATGAWDSREVKDPFVFFDPADNTYYMLYAGIASGSEWQIGLASKSTPDGTFARLGTNPVIARVAGTIENQVFAPSLIKDIAEPDINKRFKLLYTGIDNTLSTFRIFMATAPAMAGPWTKQGLLLDAGPAGAFDQDGYSRPRPAFENGEWLVMLSAKNSSETGGPWRVTYASGTSLHNLTRSGVVLVDKGIGPAQDITANVSGRIVSVASTAGFVADGYVQFNQDAQPNNWGQSRIRKVVDATILELYHGLDGFTTSTPAKIVQVDGAARIEIADIRRFGSKWYMYVTVFGFFGAFTNINAFGELNGVLVADSLAGPYLWSHLATPAFTLGSWKNERSNENITFVHTPVGTPVQNPDNTPPETSITSLHEGDTLSGTVTVTADAIDDTAVVGVQFKLDGNNLGPEDTTAPYSVAWNTTQFSNGSHILTCVARDAAGNIGVSSPVTCSVSNNYGLSFDGINDVVVGLMQSPPAQLSISTWINPASLGENSSGHIFSIRDDADNNPNLQLRLLSGNRIRFLVLFDNAGALTAGQWDTPSNSVTLNALQHIAVVYDGSSAANDPIIYINGAPQPLVKGSSPVGVMRIDPAPWRIGNNPATSATFKGIMDEMRIYSRILLVSEVATLYNNGQIIPGQPDTGLIAAWHFNEGTGTTAFDYSGNDHHVILVNGPLWVIH
jgi:hypothetical protein